MKCLVAGGKAKFNSFSLETSFHEHSWKSGKQNSVMI